MIRRSVLALFGILAVIFAAPLAAQDANSDVRCFIVSNVFAKAAPDEKGRQAANLTRLYYLGRVDARLTLAQMKASLGAQGKTLDMATAGTVMNQCVQRLGQKTKAIEAIGQELSKSAEK